MNIFAFIFGIFYTAFGLVLSLFCLLFGPFLLFSQSLAHFLAQLFSRPHHRYSNLRPIGTYEYFRGFSGP